MHFFEGGRKQVSRDDLEMTRHGVTKKEVQKDENLQEIC